jgi:2-acylglycerol O-acyltransferase 2
MSDTTIYISAASTKMKQGREEEEGLSRWRVFRAGTAADGACSPVRTLVALSLWPGAFHFNLVLVIACIFVFPARVAVLYVCPSYYIYFILFFICVMISDKYIMLLHMHATQVVGCKIIYLHACMHVYACRVLCTQLFFMFLPVSATDKWGCSIARFICKHGLSYFPVTLQVEHYQAFDPKTAYGTIKLTYLSLSF